MIMIGSFVFNLWCAMVPCDFVFGLPEIAAARTGRAQMQEPLVTTKSGTLQGYFMTSMEGRQFYAFEGIRYALPPSGELRFQPPVPSKPWNGVYKAHKPGPDCLQLSVLRMFRVYGNEDCLFLNVYTPQLSDSRNGSKLPVILHIHGGSFHMGAGREQGPTYMLDQNVVLVTINYRLGILGFLSTSDHINPGNYGLKDQGIALKWTYENIEHFGGDPEKITIMGQSAGAASVHYHLISETTRKYFRSAVSISGTIFNMWALNSAKTVRRYNQKLSQITGCSLFSSDEFMKCLRKIRSERLVSIQFQLYEEFYYPPCMFTPVVEPNLPGAFLTQTPTDAYLTGNVAKVPWITSLTSEEGHAALLISQAFQQLLTIRKRVVEIAPVYFGYKYEMNNITEITEAIVTYYHGSPTVDTSGASSSMERDQLSEAFSDRYFTYATHHSVVAHSRIAPTYVYFFSYRGVHNLANAIGYTTEEWGVGHAEDLFYFYNCSVVVQAMKRSEPDYQVSRLLTNLVHNFAEHGEPLYTGEDGVNTKIWDTVGTNSSDLQFLQVDKEVKMISEPFLKRIRFWENLGLPDMQAWAWEN